MSPDLRSILSGRRGDPAAVIIRGGLSLASFVYGAAVRWRNRRFDTGSRPVHRCGVPVISVGNLTTGGTGKTPVVRFLAERFRRQGIRVAIVSRGYGRGKRDINDEALELHDRLPDVPHVQDPDRVEAARIAVEELESELVLMDDGFQHRRLGRDLDLVVIDATCPFGYGHLLPRGLLREPLKSLRRADLALVTRVEATDVSTVEAIREAVRSAAPNLACATCGHRPTSLLEYPARKLPIETLASSRVAVVSAIGNPAAFLHTVTGCGATIVDHRDLPDHDPYAPATVEALQSWIRSLPADVERIVCTHKDLVKLRTDRLGGKPLAAVRIDLEVVEGMKALDGALAEVISRVQKK